MDPREAPIRHLLVRAPNWVGDLAMATPLIDAVAAAPRIERVTVAARPHLCGLLEDGRHGVAVVASGGAEREDWRGLGADAVLLLSNSLGAAWRAFRAGIPVRVGAALGARGLLLTHPVRPPSRAGRRVAYPTAALFRDLAGRLGVTLGDLRPRLPVRPEQRERMRATLAEAGLPPGRRYVVCAPSAAFGAAKLWPPEHFAAALDALHERRGLVAVITGGPGEEPQMEAVRRATRHPAVSLADRPRDLVALKALVAGAALVLVADSGPRWFAAAHAIPCVTVMGPNFPELTASSLEWCEVVRLEDLECAPCLRRRCPLGHQRCLRDLAPERVVAAAERLLDRSS